MFLPGSDPLLDFFAALYMAANPDAAIESPWDMANGEHKHRCPKCGCVWQHPETCVASDADHHCPVCDTYENCKCNKHVKATYFYQSPGRYQFDPHHDKKPEPQTVN